MRKFSFRLQSVLDHAVRVEQTWEMELADARRGLANADRALMRVMREREEVLQRSRQDKGAVNLAQLQESWAYASQLGDELERLKRTVEGLAAEVRQRQASLAEASKRRALLERLREQKRADYEAEVAKGEQAAQDETARTKHLRAV